MVRVSPYERSGPDPAPGAGAMTSTQTETARATQRRYPVGVEIVRQPDGTFGIHSRVWAPAARTLELVIEDDRGASTASLLSAEGNGYYSGYTPNAEAGTRYRFRIDGGESYPDPASRFQPEGPHGPSMVIDPAGFAWRDGDWRGVSIEGQVLYELHIGTFTKEGTFRAAA